MPPPSSSAITYSDSGYSLRGPALAEKVIEWDILTFLGVVQKLKIDFLPVTWQPALEVIGRGATAEIRQALVHSQIAFAFKHTRRSRLKEDEAATFRALIAEVMVLGHPLIKKHRQIITLEGISWDVVDGGASILPVLVFEKAPHGSLLQFMMHDLGRRLRFRDRVSLCIDIAKAVVQMHTNNIVHGDIKPENILVFNDNPEGCFGSYFGKVSDFGYSTWFARDDELIKMPKSPPWYAPEWHHRGFKVSDAMKMDAYSFGMLSLWLLFYNSVGSSILQFRNEIWSLEPKNRASIAHKIIASRPNIRGKQRSNLEEFFACTLEPNPANRNSNFKYLLRLLTPPKVHLSDSEWFSDPSETSDSPETIFSPYEPSFDDLSLSPSIALWADNFRIAISMAQLYQFDYHVRSHIVKCLDHRNARSTKNTNGLASQNSAFQLALCYEVGFGIKRDTERASTILQRTTQHREEIDHEICKLRGESGKLRFRPGMFEDLRRQGLFTPFDLLQHHCGHQRLDELETVYRREIADLQSVLGNSCEMVQTLNIKLAEILGEQDRWQDAEDLQRQVLGLSNRILGKSHPDTLTIRENLATMYQHQNRWKSAQEVGLQVTCRRMRALHAQHPQTLKSMGDLISMYQNEARWKAAGMPRTGIKKTKKALGKMHPDMLATIANVTGFCWNQDRWHQACTLEKYILLISNKLFGDGNPISLMSMDTLVWISLNQFQVRKAEKLLMEVIDKRKTTAGYEHPDMMRSISHLSLMFCMKGQWGLAADLEKQAIKCKTQALGEEYPGNLTDMANLASRFWTLGQWEKAEVLQLQIVQKARKALGNEHHFTNTVRYDLLLTYQSQGKWKEWEEICEQIVDTKAMVSGSDKSPENLMNMINLASAYQTRGRWNAAQKVQAEIRGLKEELEDREEWYEDTLNGVSTLASLYQASGQFEKAEEFDSKLTEMRKKVLGDEESDTLTRMKDLATTFRYQGLWQEAKELETQMMLVKHELASHFPMTFRPEENGSLTGCHRHGCWTDIEKVELRTFEGNKKAFGDEDPRTLRSMADLALTQLIHGRFEKAAKLQRHIVDSYRSSIGGGRHITLKSMYDLISTYRHQGSRDEAEELERQAEEIKKNIELDFPAALTSAGNLTLTCRNQNRWKGAELLQMRIMKHNQKSLGVEHPYTLSSMASLASTYASQSRWTEAEELQILVMERNRRILGDGHPDTLLSIEYLALTYWNQGRWKQTEDLELQIMKVKNDLLGNDHVDTIGSISNLALTYRNQGRFPEAIELQSHVLKTQEKMLGKRHPETLKSMTELASIYWGHNQLEVVRDLQTPAVNIRETELGDDNPETLESLDILMMTLLKLAQKEEAEKLAAQILGIKKERLGDEHPSTVKTLSNLASLYQAQQRWEEAKTLNSQILDIQKRVLGEKDPDTLATISNLAMVYSNQGLWKEAEELQRRGLHIGKRELGEEHPLCMKLTNDLMSTYQGQGCWERLEKLSEDFQRTTGKLSRAEYPDLLAKVAGLALTCWDQGNWDDAVKLSLQVVEIEERTFPEKHSSISSMANLASAHWSESRYEEAKLVEGMVVERNQKTLGSDHPNVLRRLRNLVSVYRVSKRYREAEEQATKVIEIGQKFGGKVYPGILGDMESLALIYLEQGRFEDGDELFTQITEMEKETPLTERLGTATQTSMTAVASGIEKQWEKKTDDMKADWHLGRYQTSQGAVYYPERRRSSSKATSPLRKVKAGQVLEVT